jgi:RNA polymerase sigma-70 factor, ECF subfamily
MIAETGDDGLDDMRRAIYALKDEYREPLVLQVLMGHSCREIAEILGLNQGAVLTRLHRARKKLKESINGGSECLNIAGRTDGL